MVYMIGIYAAESFAPMVFFFTIVWFLMRKKDEKLKFPIIWYIGGLFVSLILAGIVRYSLISFFGYAPALNANKDALFTIFAIVPIILSIIVCALIRTKYQKINKV